MVLRPRKLIGRESELREVAESIASAPVTTLTGPGGVGKTALAIAVAAACAGDFPDGVIVVWFGSVRSPELVAAEVAAQLELPQSGGQSYENALVPWLIDRDVLLVIDNCEHVLSAVADLVDALTARLPRLRVLATSREPLWIEGEATFRLTPLSVEPAVQLFRERAGLRGNDDEQSKETFAKICRRVDGLPLAIELAAARVAALDPTDIASHLDDLFDLLPQPARRADGALRSLRATVEWSDALLTEEERRLLRRIGVFARGFDLAAIKSVCADEGQSAAQVADLTARLVEKSLLSKLDGGGYELLETIRQYCVVQLTTAGEIDPLRERHARFYSKVALEACAGLFAGPERPHLDVLARTEDNLRVALDCLLRIDPTAALLLAASLPLFWWTRGKLREGLRWVEQALASNADAPAELRASAWFGHGFLLAHDTNDWSAAASSLDIGIDLVRDASEPRPPILGMLMCLRGECDVFAGDPKAAVRRTEAGLDIVRRHPAGKGSWAEFFCLWNVAHAKRADGDPAVAIAMFRECADVCTRLGTIVAEMVACNSLGEMEEERGDLAASRAFFERALSCRERTGAIDVGYVHGSMPLNLFAVARVAAKQGDLATASKLLRDALPIAQAIRDTATAEKISELLAQTSKTEPTHGATLRPEGSVWHVAWSGTSVHVPDMKGLWHLRELVSRPRESVLALSLIAAPTEDPIPVGDAGPMLDREALRQYRKRLADLDDELDDAEAKHDGARHAKRSAEREALLKELARATGLGGTPRRTGSPTEKARLNVTRTIRHAITQLSTALPELAAHLDESLSTGVSCCYEPRANVSWTT
jgi:predicted ATPase